MKRQRQRLPANVANHGSTMRSCTAATAAARVKDTHCVVFVKWSFVKGYTNASGLTADDSCTEMVLCEPRSYDQDCRAR